MVFCGTAHITQYIVNDNNLFSTQLLHESLSAMLFRTNVDQMCSRLGLVYFRANLDCVISTYELFGLYFSTLLIDTD